MRWARAEISHSRAQEFLGDAELAENRVSIEKTTGTVTRRAPFNGTSTTAAVSSSPLWSGARGWLVHSKALAGTRPFNTSTVLVRGPLDIRVSSGNLSHPCTWSFVRQGWAERVRLAQGGQVLHVRWNDALRSSDSYFRRPESLGLVCAAIYILSLILFIPFAFTTPIKEHVRAIQATKGIAIPEFPHYQASCCVHFSSPVLTCLQLSVYLSSLLSLLIATMLGFLDDLFDIRWRHKLPIPVIASIPLLMVYYAEGGNTNVVVPIPLRPILGKLVNLGAFVNICAQPYSEWI